MGLMFLAGMGFCEKRGRDHFGAFASEPNPFPVVLAGGAKRTQRIDIKTAQRIAAEWERGS